MVRLLSGLVLGIAVCAYTAFCVADDKEEPKQVTIDGKIGCAKCDLKIEGQKKCATVVYTTAKDDKKTVHWFDAAAHKKYHSEICQETKPGTVTGTVKKDGDKLVITVKELKFKK